MLEDRTSGDDVTTGPGQQTEHLQSARRQRQNRPVESGHLIDDEDRGGRVQREDRRPYYGTIESLGHVRESGFRMLRSPPFAVTTG